MRNTKTNAIVIIANLLILIISALLTTARVNQNPDWFSIILFGFLIVFTMTFGIALAGGMVSLLPMVAIAVYFRFGLVTTGWLLYGCAWIHGVFRFYFSERLNLPFAATNPSERIRRIGVNAVMVTASILIGGAIYERLGGAPPMADGYPVWILMLGAGYFFVNYLLAGLYFLLTGEGQITTFLRSLPKLLFYEAVPVLFAPFITLIYAALGWLYFVLLIIGVVVITFVTRGLNEVSARLNRRVQELDSIQIVGQLLNASLEIDAIAHAIYKQVVHLMPASAFYIGLYDQENDALSFPFVVEAAVPVQWPTRRMGNGLVAYVLRTRRPLLIKQDVAETAVSLGLDPMEKKAVCWLGVPLLQADKPLGVIVVQSASQPKVYDNWHQEILLTIASQAAMAVENARLYAQTGSALAQRAQEMDSILQTIHDGVMLLDKKCRVLTINRAFTDMMGLPNVALTDQSLMDGSDDAKTLLKRIGYYKRNLERDCALLQQGEKPHIRQIVMTDSPERHIERTLAPVRDQEQIIIGWLFVFRDITEEVELIKTREDMTHMVIHDLRSPLSVTLGSLETIGAWLEMGRMEDVNKLLGLARTSGNRMLQLLNDLLNIYKFESDKMPLRIESMPIAPWLMEAKAQFLLTAAEVEIGIEVEVEPELPLIAVDKEHMVRVLSNLVDNAIKFTPDGGRIRLWAKGTVDDDRPIVLIGVSDTGMGIPPADHERLFLKFQQNSLSRGRRQGTGLGLPYCKLVVEAHGGRIWVESQGIAGQGSTFVMQLPTLVEGD